MNSTNGWRRFGIRWPERTTTVEFVKRANALMCVCSARARSGRVPRESCWFNRAASGSSADFSARVSVSASEDRMSK